MMKGERGFSLAEVMIAIALLGVVSVAFLSAISTASNAVFIADEQATGESLARSAMEYIRSQDYIDYSTPDHEEYEKITPPAGYEVELEVVLLNYKGDETDNDDGIQKIIVTVEHLEKQEVVKLESYKSWRLY